MINCVEIRTENNMGSGVILSCDVDPRNWGKLKNDEKSYIILTNYHVLQDIEQEPEQIHCSKDKKNNIRLTILDINGDEVEQDMIQHVYVDSGCNYSQESDIAAILVIIKDCCKVACSNDIFIGEHNGKLIRIYGYPYVLQSDFISQDIAMDGIVQKYTNEGMGIYKIKDDYHYYSEMPDKKLMEGISGAPIYLKEDKDYLIGINESVCNIGNGKNPFKMVYFLPIERVLTWLANQNIILYKYENKSVKILWIMPRELWKEELEDTKPIRKIYELDLQKAKNIVMIGGSGAGKSSLIRTLCQHGDVLDAVGDGQTTRMNIEYALSTKQIDPTIKINFYSIGEFCNKRMESFGIRICEWELCQLFGCKRKNILEDPCAYFQDIINLFMPPKAKAEEKKINYDKFGVLINRIHEIQLENKNNDSEKSDVLLERIIKLYNDCIHIMKKECKKFTNDKKSSGDNKYIELKKILENDEGFYDIREFGFLFDIKAEWEVKCDEILKKHFGDIFEVGEDVDFEKGDGEEKSIKNYDEEKEWGGYNTLMQNAMLYYHCIYCALKEKLKDIGIYLDEELEYNLEEVTNKDMKIIARCLRKVSNDSLSSIIKRIEIEDKFSDIYSYDLYMRDIRYLRIYDTCGYDHVRRSGVKVYFKDLFNQIKGRRIEWGVTTYKSKLDAIIYVKKLDSEKPSELKEILPQIMYMEETTPVFCVFTALDQYVTNINQIPSKLIWNEEYKEKWSKASVTDEFIFPKIVQSIMDNEDFLSKSGMPNYKQEKVLDFLKNHMLPYASKYEINNNNIISMNRNSLMNILKSILQNEWNIHFIKLKEYNNDELGKYVEQDLDKMFEKISVTDWEERHTSTILANFKRIYRKKNKENKTDEDMGLNRTFINRWDNLFEDGFSESFLSDKSCVIEYLYKYIVVKDDKKEEKQQYVYDILAELKSEIITSEMGIWKKYNKENKNITEFMKYIVDLYTNIEIEIGGETKIVNIFEYQTEDINTTQGKIDFLNQIYNFKKLWENYGNRSSMVEYFCKKINELINNNNKNCFEILINNDETFNDSVNYIRKVIEKYNYEISEEASFDNIY
jgi:hypothetical protein